MWSKGEFASALNDDARTHRQSPIAHTPLAQGGKPMATRKPDVYEQYLNVMEGYTADGDQLGGPKQPLGGQRNAPNIGLLILVLFRDLEQHMPDEMASDRVRTAVILVFVRWMRLTNTVTTKRITDLMRRVGASAS